MTIGNTDRLGPTAGSRDVVAELRDLLSRATPGPWTAGDYDGETSFGVHGGGPDAPHDYNVCEIAWWAGADHEASVNKADGYLIAALRNAAPDLLRLAEMVGQAREPLIEDDLYEAWVLARKLTGGAT